MFCPSSRTFNAAILAKSSARLRTEASLTGASALPIILRSPNEADSRLNIHRPPRPIRIGRTISSMNDRCQIQHDSKIVPHVNCRAHLSRIQRVIQNIRNQLLQDDRRPPPSAPSCPAGNKMAPRRLINARLGGAVPALPACPGAASAPPAVLAARLPACPARKMRMPGHNGLRGNPVCGAAPRGISE